MTVTSINSLNPANDPDSMVAFLPNVRRNTMERMPSTEDPRYLASDIKKIHHPLQGCNARKVISEVYAFFVLQCSVF